MELALEEDTESLTTAALMLMKKYLPEYIVNCFVAAGYDTLDVIADMDVSDKPGNTLEEIATFIAKEYPGDPRFVRGTMSRSSVFPPGHHRRIASFVKHVNHLQEEKKRSSRKRRTMSSTHPPKKKRSDANAKRRRPANRVTKVETCLVYCYCRLPDNGRRMVCCDLCEEWYHVDCARTHELGPENCWFCDHCKPTL
jgi:hypothetical protein